MFYYSLNKQAPIVDFKTATIQGQAPDKGLYFPESIPKHAPEFINNLKNLSNEQIAFEVIKPYVGNCLSNDVLWEIVSETVNFPIPLHTITDHISVLELFHGPTLAFKDIGARFMSRCLKTFLKDSDKKVTVLVATSGDTGSAVANGFFDMDGIEVIILYPSGKVSALQEQQLTTLGNNISTLEVQGSFDDCQQMVKQAFADTDITQKRQLSSANSINIARWLPQQFYYFFAMKQWEETEAPVFCVPSGNFGNICAGILAYASGLPAAHFIAACNANDAVPQFLKQGVYAVKPPIATISNAMDVANPSNFVRVLEIFQQQVTALSSMVSSYSISDEQTENVLKEVYKKYSYLLDPHGAVGYAAIEQYQQLHPQQHCILLETAHPLKFTNIVAPLIERTIDLPDQLKSLMLKQKKAITLKNDYAALKAFLLN